MELSVQIKQAGKRANKITTAKLFLKETPTTIRELLTSTVKANLNIHKEKIKQLETFENGDLDYVILYTQDEIEQKARAGRIDFDFLKSSADVSEKKAVESALQAFEDGLIALFIDDTRYEDIDDKIELSGNETLTFVKLTMLTGRLW